jgi:predicted permease
MRRLRALFSKDRMEKQLEKELRFHIEQQVRDNAAAGMTEEQARREAMLAFGGAEQIKEECRDERGVNWFEDALQDLRFGLRLLRKDRGYTFAALLALALGIGANTALFALFNGVALRPLPVTEPERVVSLYRSTAQLPFPGPFSFVDYEYIRDHSALFAFVSANSAAHLRMSGVSSSVNSQPSGSANILGISGPNQIQGGSEYVIGLFVTSDYFSVMGVSPVLGHGFRPGDDRGGAAVYPAMLSENFWERRFGRDPGILGKHVMFSGIPVVIAGITPRDFMGTRPGVPDVWIPIGAIRNPQPKPAERNNLCCFVEARLKPSARFDQVQAALPVLNAALHREHPDSDQKSQLRVEPAVPFGSGHRAFDILFAVFQPAIGLVLLIACANVAGLLLGRAAARQREIAVRLALGASRGRLVRQLVTEGILLAQIAGVISLGITWWMLRAGVRFVFATLASSGLTDNTTVPLNVAPDFRVFLYTVSIGMIAGLLFALAPALQATRPNLTSALKEESTPFGGTRKSRFRGWMVGTQIAVCLMLLLGAGMLVRSSIRLLTTDPGFDAPHVLDVSILNPLELGYTAARADQLHKEVLERLRALPGVKSIATASRVPLGGNVMNVIVYAQGSRIAGDPQALSQAPQFAFTFVSFKYFETLGIPLLRGRGFTEQEINGRAPVTILSAAVARTLWPGEDPIGKHVTIGSPAQASASFGRPLPFSASSEVIGIARDVYSVTSIAPDPGALYLPQLPGQWDQNLLVRTESDSRAVASAIASEVQSVDRNLSVSLQSLSKVITTEGGFVTTRVTGIVFSLIGLLGLVLASVGIYSMVGFTVSQQTREIGIRMALGAQRSDVLRLVLRRSMRPIAAGILAGMALGTALSFALSALFQGLKLLNAPVIAGVSLLLTAIALIASYLPARRAADLDPATSLRFE